MEAIIDLAKVLRGVIHFLVFIWVFGRLIYCRYNDKQPSGVELLAMLFLSL